MGLGQMYQVKIKYISFNSIMITSKKPPSKVKKSLSSHNLPSKGKLSKPKKDLPDPHEKLKKTEPGPMHQSSTDTFRTFKYNEGGHRNKDSSQFNPYFQLFEKCQKNVGSVEEEIAREKQRMKGVEKRVLREKREDRVKNVTFSPSKELKGKGEVEGQRTKKKHRASKSVDNIRNVERQHCRVNSESQERGVKGKKTINHNQSKHERVLSNISAAKPRCSGDVLKAPKKDKQQPPTLKKDFSKSKPALKSKSKSTKIIAPPKTKLSNRQYLNRDTKCVSELEMRRKSDGYGFKNGGTSEHKRTYDGSSDDSLVTIEDFGEESKEEKLRSLISEIQEHVEDQRIQRKLHELSRMATKYLKISDDGKKEKGTKPEFKLYELNQEVISSQIPPAHIPPTEQREEQSAEQQRILPTENSNNVFLFEQPTYTPVQSKLALTSNDPDYQSPPSLSQIQKILNQRSIISNTKYKSKLKVLYKLYQNNLYSPRTFQNKLNLLDSIQDQELNENMELSRRIRGLAKQIVDDKEEIHQLQTVFKEERWEDADEIIKVKEEEQGMKKALKQFIKSPRPPIVSQTLQLPTSPVQQQKNIKINQIFQQFYKLTPDLLQDNCISDQREQVLYDRDHTHKDSLDLSQISAIRSYCINIFKYIVETPSLLKEFVTNLVTPIQYNINDLLMIYHIDFAQEQSKPYSCLSYYYWKRSLQMRQIISADSIEEIIVHLDCNTQDVSNLSLIHQRMIFDVLNESLSHQLSISPSILSLSTSNHSKHSKYQRILQSYFTGCYESQEQVENIYIRSVERLIGWARYYCGTLPETFMEEARRGEGEESGESEESRRQIRMALLLHVSLSQIQSEIRDITMTQIQMKLRLERCIQETLIQQAINQLRGFRK